MGEYTATVRWLLGDGDFPGNRYTRAHEWSFDGGLTVPASASPHIVPPPLSVAENIDPEEAFVASLSSCHMLFFLSLAARRGIVVESYTDEASGRMEKDADGRMAMSRVVLRPRAVYQGDSSPDSQEVGRLHHRAHELCFIANSVKTEIVTEIIS
jgi:organic hydroperoxide reductase OsmC/OhrA